MPPKGFHRIRHYGLLAIASAQLCAVAGGRQQAQRRFLGPPSQALRAYSARQPADGDGGILIALCMFRGLLPAGSFPESFRTPALAAVARFGMGRHPKTSTIAEETSLA
jgi:hypothetical protein